MFPLDLEPLRKFFSAALRQRGNDYVRERCVEGLRAEGEVVTAVVVGNDEYDVTLCYAFGSIEATCTCPYFAREGLCKHIWAVLLVCDQKGVGFSGRARTIIADYSDYDDEELADDIDEYAPSSNGRTSPLRASTSGADTLLRFPQRHTPRPAPSRWREQLALLRSHEREGHAQPPSEITWVVDPAATHEGIALEITRRALKKNGEVGKPQSMSVERAQLSSIPDPLDREILSVLFGPYSYRESKLFVYSPLAQFLIPKVAATGRLLMRVENREYVPATLDDGDPFTLRISAEDRGDDYVLSAWFVRGGQRIPLTGVLGFSPDFVFFRGAIVRLEGRHSLAWASALRREPVKIPKRETDDFLGAVAESRGSMEIEFPLDVQWNEERVKPRASLRLHEEAWNRVWGSPEFAYAGRSVNAFAPVRGLFDESKRTFYLRDSDEERTLLDAIWKAGLLRSGETVYGDSRRIAPAIGELVAAGWEITSAEGTFAGGGELEIGISSGIDWFDLEASVAFGSERVTLPRLLSALRDGASHVRLDDGKLGLIRPEWKAQLEPFLAIAAEERGGRVRFRSNQVLILDALLAARPAASFDAVFENARRRVLDAKLQPQLPPPSFRGELRPYQSEALGWLAFLREIGFGGCLADDMGLGKTIQVLALLEGRRASDEHRPSLVVAPRSVIFNWKSEAERFTPGLRLLDHSTSDRTRETDRFGDYDLILTTYALLRKEVEILREVEFDYVVLDESQAIKNAASQSAKAATLLKAHHRLALSGTPIENHLGEIASLFEFLNPGMLRGKSSRVSTLLRGAGARTPEAAEQRAVLARAVRPFILRRTKAQVAAELPERTEQTIYCELEPRQRRLYDELRDYYRASLLGRIAEKGLQKSKIHVLEALLRMRQAACHPALVDPGRSGEESAKLAVLLERLPVLVDERHKVLVFSQFTSMLSIVRREVQQRRIPYAYLDGKSLDRAEQVRRFQEDPEVPLFLISLKAGGLGLNLTAAEYVYLLDPWWNPAVEAQAIDRAHRIGQSRNVFAYRLVARHTIEEKILLLQQSKRALADAIISEENSILRNLTAEDLELLLS